MTSKDSLTSLIGHKGPISQESKGDRSPNIIAEHVDIIYESKVPVPPLQMLVFPVSCSTRMHFRARRVPFLGRIAELQRLQTFLGSEALFSWWLITGEAGSGKSRLALELCLQHQEDWAGGFLPENSGYDSWSQWQPQRRTLIVADYCSLRSPELQDIVTTLSTQAPPLQHQVRLLLVERSTNGEWLKNFLGVGSTRLLIESTRYGDPLQTSPMSNNELWRAITFLFETSDLSKFPDEQETLQALFELDPLRRPLFAALAADALIAGRDIRLWDQAALLRDVLEREEEKFWKPAGVTERDKNLLCLATLQSGMLVEDLTFIAPAELADANLPTTEAVDPQRFDAGRYQTMTSLPSTEFLAPLKPDILGEFYSLERLLPRDTADQKRAFITLGIAWLGRPTEVFDFVTRVLDDFPAHPGLAIIDLSLKKSCIQFLANLTKDDQGVDEANWTIAMLAAAKSHFVLRCGERGMIDAAHLHLKELFEISDEWSGHDLLEKIALSAVPMLCSSGDTDTRKLFHWVGQRWKEKGSNSEHLELLIKATFLRATRLVEEKQFDQALTLIHEAIWISENFAHSESQYGTLAEQMRMIIAAFGETKPETAEYVFALLAEFRERASEDMKYVSNLALAAFLILHDSLDVADCENGPPNLPELVNSARFVVQCPKLKEGIATELGSEIGNSIIPILYQYVKIFDDMNGEVGQKSS